MRFAQTAGVDNRSLALPLSRYPKLSGFTESNDAYLEVAVDLGEQAMRKALAEANIEPHEVDTIVMVSSTGIAVPTIDARLMSRIGLRPNIKRVPLFVLGCADISTWVCHSGGPKVLESVENTLGLPPQALAHSRNSMRENGNMSSVSVLDVLRRTVAEPPSAGAFGVMLAMGPGFSFELLVLQW